MKISSSIILVFLVFISFGQSAKIDTLKFKISGKSKEIQSDKMFFPIVITGNDEIDSLINFDIKNKFTKNTSNESSDSILLRWARYNIYFLDFKVSYNKDWILSLSINAKGCGSHCDYWTEYYNYSLKTGLSLNLSNIVDLSGDFKELIFNQKKLEFEKQKTILKKKILNRKLDANTYDQALYYYKNCNDLFNLENYKISNDSLEIIYDCHFPRLFYLSPKVKLKFELTAINKYLKIKTSHNTVYK